MPFKSWKLLLAFLAAAWDPMDCLESDSDWRDCVNQTVFDRGGRRRERPIGAAAGQATAVFTPATKPAIF